VRFLLDTHIAVWWVTCDPRLPEDARLLISDPANDFHVSAASIWEIAIKSALRRGHPDDMKMTGHEALADFERTGFMLLPIEPEHAAAVDDLGLRHSDPFDRILVAQAGKEDMRLMTHDRTLVAYGDFVELV
jgi:PIN domain nuclease of toxin-antitoxin system